MSPEQLVHVGDVYLQGPWQQKQQYQKVRNSFLLDRHRRGMKGKINWEGCSSTAAVDTIEMDNVVLFQQECYSHPIAMVAGNDRKDEKGKRAASLSPREDIHGCSTLTETEADRETQWPTSLATDSIYYLKEQSFHQNSNGEVWQLKVTRLILSNKEWPAKRKFNLLIKHWYIQESSTVGKGSMRWVWGTTLEKTCLGRPAPRRKTKDFATRPANRLDNWMTHWY